jgi:hypothetical protein
MCWASCSLRYCERRTWSSPSLRGDSASAASEYKLVGSCYGGYMEASLILAWLECIVRMVWTRLQQDSWLDDDEQLHVTLHSNNYSGLGLGIPQKHSKEKLNPCMEVWEERTSNISVTVENECTTGTCTVMC